MILQVVDVYPTNPPNLHEDFLQDLDIVAMVRGVKKHHGMAGQPTLL